MRYRGIQNSTYLLWDHSSTHNRMQLEKSLSAAYLLFDFWVHSPCCPEPGRQACMDHTREPLCALVSSWVCQWQEIGCKRRMGWGGVYFSLEDEACNHSWLCVIMKPYPQISLLLGTLKGFFKPSGLRSIISLPTSPCPA